MKTKSQSNNFLLIVWLIVLLSSGLPRIVLQEVFGQTVSSDLQAIISISVISLGLLVTLIWHPLQKLRPFFFIYLVMIAVQWFVFNQVDTLPFFRDRLRNPNFNVYMLTEQSLNLMVTMLMMGTLLLMKKKPADFFLARGNLAAPVAPIGWMGVKPGERWNKFGALLALFISMGTLAFLILAGNPSIKMISKVIPFLPAILLAAALNAFNEEMTYKASFLSVLEKPMGSQQSLLIVAAYFGIAHFYGVPYGMIGVLLAGFLGWILARSMLETRGMFWAWFIHFLQDVWIFSFMAINAIIPGGG
ncbi:MAG TPA: CPBP family intramembrane glutamic endopeptidase [Anaerolineales bacterium]|nr:CPBP family intramembrane glutamic endopeptidase [Anaerolineales bacterium]